MLGTTLPPSGALSAERREAVSGVAPKPEPATARGGFPAEAGCPLLVGHSVIRLSKPHPIEVEALPLRGGAKLLLGMRAWRSDTLFSREGARPSPYLPSRRKASGAPLRRPLGPVGAAVRRGCRLFENCIASMESLEFSMFKLPRVYGGCLGVESR